MQHTLRFRDDDTVLLEEHTLAYGLACGYERGATELGVPAGWQVRMELLDDTGYLLDWRTYQVAGTGGHFPALLPEPQRWSPHPMNCADPGQSQSRRLNRR